jgi:hypothetical protein
MIMRKCGIVTVMAFFLFPVAEIKAEISPLSILSDDISAFICAEIDSINDVPLIFVNEGKNWTLSGFEELSVSKIENGFKFKSSGDEEGLGFLRSTNHNKWDFQYLDKKGYNKTICTSQDYFVGLLIESIAAKIIKNANLLKKIMEINN